MTYTLHCGDCIEVMARLDANSVDTVITDPPYGLSDIDAATTEQVLRAWLNDAQHDGSGSGFMGREWDAFVPGPMYWKAVYRVMKPGGTLLAFGGTRTYDLLTLALRLAGFEIRDTVQWLYGSGFPGGLNISKAIDKAAGAEREVVGEYQWPDGNHRNLEKHKAGIWDNDTVHGDGHRSITAPATPKAAQWDGWGTRLKPAHEQIVVAMKPRDGTFANNALTWGVAGYWIDGGRITNNSEPPKWHDVAMAIGEAQLTAEEREHLREVACDTEKQPKGRFPANIILQHAPGCVQRGTREVGSGEACMTWHNERYGTSLTESENERETLGSYGRETIADWDCVPGCPVRTLAEQGGDALDDDGPKSRFFYQAKASRKERHAGLDDFYWQRDKASPTGFVRVSREVYESLPKRQRAPGNIHPTVKPLGLLEYLARLTRTPSGGVVLDPFMGSGSTGAACIAEGRDFIGIDLYSDYVDIARARIEHAARAVEQLRLGETL